MIVAQAMAGKSAIIEQMFSSRSGELSLKGLALHKNFGKCGAFPGDIAASQRARIDLRFY
jgi:hypothetical protein